MCIIKKIIFIQQVTINILLFYNTTLHL